MPTIVSMEGRLLHELDRCREREHLSGRALAVRLHVSDSYLSMVFSGSRPVGMTLLRGIARAFPELHPAILEHLVNGHDA